MATVWKPISAAYWTPRWPSPPSPSTATTSPGRAPLLRRALNVVRPAHIRGAASTGGRSAGIRPTALAEALWDSPQASRNLLFRRLPRQPDEQSPQRARVLESPRPLVHT